MKLVIKKALDKGVQMSKDLNKEREVMMVMRKVLSSIVKDTTPAHRDLKHPLSESTIQDIRMCFGLIASRERELADLAGITPEMPHYTDEKVSAEVISFTKITKIEKNDD